MLEQEDQDDRDKDAARLDDLCVRFIINLPQEELQSVERICFQVEEAQWFYEDFIRPLDPDLPSLNLRNFCLRIFQHCPLLSQFSSYHHSTAFSEFLAYKTRVPVRGAIMLNNDLDAVILVKGWKKGANWSFPRGKINKAEPDLDCAIREVYEETGFDLREAGLVAEEENMKYIEITMREQHMRLYVFRDVPMNTQFEPKTRKEISKIQWYKLSELPTLKKGKNQHEGKGEDLANNANKFYMVAPFLVPLKKWISQQRKLDRHRNSGQPESMIPSAHEILDEGSNDHDTAGRSDMERLLAGLRQSGQAQRASDLPELSVPVPTISETTAPENVRLQPTSDILGVRSAAHRLDAPKSSDVDRQKSNALLALLKGNGADRAPPQTPAEQIIVNPQMPPSPKRQPADSEQRQGSSNASPYLNPTQDATRLLQPKVASVANAALQPQVIHQPLRALQNQGRNPLDIGVLKAQQAARFQAMDGQIASPTRIGPAPYQRTGDPSFTQTSQPTGFPSSIPPASKLPPPKLNPHSSALLTLFKAGANAPSEMSIARPIAPRPEVAAVEGKPSFVDGNRQITTKGNGAYRADQPLQPTPADVVSEMSGVESGNEPNSHHGITKPTSSSLEATVSSPDNPYANDPKVQAAMVALHLVPPATGEKPSAPIKPQNEHQDALLGLFRAPPVKPVESKETTKASLDLPHTSFELSALPSPGHSREPSRDNESARNQTAGPSTRHLTGHHKQTRAVLAPRKPTVSATVDGPLNVPQFDKLLTKPKADSSKVNNRSNKETVKILQRPLQSGSIMAASDPNGLVVSEESTLAPPNTMVSTPNLPAQSVPPENPLFTPVKSNPTPQGQPEMLRRPRPPIPKPSQNDTILSPIDPLPSPRHMVPVDRRANQTQEHKTSLLALFSRPSQSPAETPTRAGSALVSPLVMTAQRDGGFGGNDMEGVGSLASLVSGGEKDVNAQMSSGRQSSRTTLTDRTFLLGYLDSVARGEKK
ncbi:MAG: hypothetical protein Q9191_001336 [Dirinaria sp. TL-2023a]